MATRAAELVAGIIDRIEDRPYRTGRPPLPTIEVVETLRFFARAGVQWRGLGAAGGGASGSPHRPPPGGRAVAGAARRGRARLRLHPAPPPGRVERHGPAAPGPCRPGRDGTLGT